MHANAGLPLELTVDRYTFTLRELLMMQIMNSITDKPDWDTKVGTDLTLEGAELSG